MNLRDLILGKPNIVKLKKARNKRALVQALCHSDWFVRWDAAKALGEVGDSSSVEHLLAVLNDAKPEVRRGAAGSLGKLSDLRAVGALMALLEREDGFVRVVIIEALGQLGDPRAIAAVVPFLKHHRREALWALGRLGPGSLPALLEAIKDPDNSALRDIVFSSFRTPASQQVMRLASHEDAQVRELVLKLMTAGGVHYLDEFLSDYLQSPNPALRSAARAILDAQTAPRPTPTHPVILSLMSDKPDERREAANRLVALLVDPDLTSRNEAFGSLSYAIHAGFLKDDPVLADAVRLAIKVGHKRRVEVLSLITLLASDLGDDRGYELVRALEAGNTAAFEGILGQF